MLLFKRIDDVKHFYKGYSDLNMLATHFIKRTYLENLTELPRMQEVPDEAFKFVNQWLEIVPTRQIVPVKYDQK